jgi:hypothetical protein
MRGTRRRDSLTRPVLAKSDPNLIHTDIHTDIKLKKSTLANHKLHNLYKLPSMPKRAKALCIRQNGSVLLAKFERNRCPGPRQWPSGPDTHVHFDKLRNRLSWPIQGA